MRRMTWHQLSVGVDVPPRPRQSRGMLLIFCQIAIGMMYCSPEVVPSEDDEPIAPQGWSSTKTSKTGKKKNTADEDMS